MKVGDTIYVRKAWNPKAADRFLITEVIPDGEYAVTEVSPRSSVGVVSPKTFGVTWFVPRSCVVAIGDMVRTDRTLDPDAVTRANIHWAMIRTSVAKFFKGGFISPSGRFVPWEIVAGPIIERTWTTTATYDSDLNPEAAKNANLPHPAKRYTIDVKSDLGSFVQSIERRYPKLCLTDWKSTSNDGLVCYKRESGWETCRGGRYLTLDTAQKSFDR